MNRLMSQSDPESHFHFFISSWVVYCNGLLTGLLKQTIKHSQLIQNAAESFIGSRETVSSWSQYGF